MTHSLPDPSLVPFDPEIERTLSHIRRTRRRLASEGESEPPSESETSSFTTDPVDLHAGNMAAPRRITL